LKHHSPASSSARPLDALLGAFASGSLSEELHALVDAHVALNPASRRFVDDLEVLCGAELSNQPRVPVTSRDAMLTRIFNESEDAAVLPLVRDGAPPVGSALVTDAMFSPRLRRLVGIASSEIPWRTVLPGVKEHVVSDRDGVEAKLYWIKAGRKIPSHTHEGQEFTLVLRGGFSDVSGHYARGDVAIADQDVDHKPVADADEDCFCFAVTDAPLKLTGPVGKVIQGLFRN
jgi:putative transcriptional regulator